jgi:DNA primase
MHYFLGLNDRKENNDRIKAVVGILGTQNFREAYTSFLSGYNEIVLCLDNDKAGKEASDQIKKKLLASREVDQKIFIYNLGVYEDVNEFLQDKKKTKV